MKILDHDQSRNGPGESTAFQTISEMSKTAKATFINNSYYKRKSSAFSGALNTFQDINQKRIPTHLTLK